MFILLFLIWLLFNNYYAWDIYFLEIVLFGLLVSGLVYLFMIKFTRFTFKRDLKFCKKFPLLILYFLVLVKEIIVSNIKVLFIILNPKDKPNPEIVSFNIDLKTHFPLLKRILMYQSTARRYSSIWLLRMIRW